jgi:DNA-binding LytR/AlgR family response regulator
MTSLTPYNAMSHSSLHKCDVLFRQAIIHTKKMKYQSNMNLNEIWEKLDERMFAAVHGSFIVNLKHVHSVSSGMVMLTDGTELGVTRGYRKELTEKHIAFVQGGM